MTSTPSRTTLSRFCEEVLDEKDKLELAVEVIRKQVANATIQIAKREAELAQAREECIDQTHRLEAQDSRFNKLQRIVTKLQNSTDKVNLKKRRNLAELRMKVQEKRRLRMKRDAALNALIRGKNAIAAFLQGKK
jgi:DNA repair ATPase RecN